MNSFLSFIMILSKSKYIGMAPILRIEEITEGKDNFEIITLLFFFTPNEYNKAVQAVVPFENDSAYFEPK